MYTAHTCTGNLKSTHIARKHKNPREKERTRERESVCVCERERHTATTYTGHSRDHNTHTHSLTYTHTDAHARTRAQTRAQTRARTQCTSLKACDSVCCSLGRHRRSSNSRPTSGHGSICGKKTPACVTWTNVFTGPVGRYRGEIPWGKAYAHDWDQGPIKRPSPRPGPDQHE